MAAITKAYFDRMSGDGTLTTLLPTFNSQPNIFSSGFVPDGAVLPWIEFSGQFTSNAFDTKTTNGRQLFTDLRTVGKRSSSAVEVEAIAERIYTLFKDHSLAVAGFVTILGDCSGPESANGSETIVRVVPCSLIIQEV